MRDYDEPRRRSFCGRCGRAPKSLREEFGGAQARVGGAQVAAIRPASYEYKKRLAIALGFGAMVVHVVAEGFEIGSRGEAEMIETEYILDAPQQRVVVVGVVVAAHCHVSRKYQCPGSAAAGSASTGRNSVGTRSFIAAGC